MENDDRVYGGVNSIATDRLLAISELGVLMAKEQACMIRSVARQDSFMLGSMMDSLIAVRIFPGYAGELKDCIVTEWSAWGQCNATCGEGAITRTRKITQKYFCGGIKCPLDLLETKPCSLPRCTTEPPLTLGESRSLHLH